VAVYLYAVCRSGGGAPTEAGLADRSLRIVEAAGLCALVDERTDLDPAATEASLWEHERVVEALLAERDLLPARFGTVLQSDSAVRDWLDRHRDELARALENVAGAVELGVRVAWTANGAARELRGDAAAGSGAAYLIARAAEQDRVERLAARLDDALGGVARDSRVRVTPPATSLSAAYLVARSQVDRFRARVEQLNRQLREADLTLTGPWPPYSFTDGAAR
jgi:hypothetical protein